MNNFALLEKYLGVTIKNSELFTLALTHPSYNADAKTKHQDYERLEFIGDAVISFCVADLIYKSHPEMDQGIMSKLRSYLVKGHTLAEYARKLHLFEFIRVGNSISTDQVKKSDKILEDVFEALVGAIYLDNGIDVVYKYLTKIFKEDVDNTNQDALTDYKTRLQEEMQAEHRDSVHYELVSQIGPAHDRTFTVNVLFENIVLGTGTGKSKKNAEEAAAKDALNKRSI
jgi:ribonuclease-3